MSVLNILALNPEMFASDQKVWTEDDVEAMFQLFYPMKGFDKTLVFLNPRLAARCIPETFDFGKYYSTGDDHSHPTCNCPYETVKIWGEAGVKFINFDDWFVNRKNLFYWSSVNQWADEATNRYYIEQTSKKEALIKPKGNKKKQ